MIACIRCEKHTGAAWRKYCPPCWDRLRGRRPATAPAAPKPPPDPRHCVECGCEVEGARVRCEPCQAQRKNAQRKKGAPLRAILACACCSEAFVPLAPRQVVCSDDCRAAREREQKAAYSRSIKSDPEWRRRRRVRRREYQKGGQAKDKAPGISVHEWLEERRPLWARDPTPAPDAWARTGQAGWG